MAVLVALLRGVNVGGRGMVGMAALRDLFTELGLAPVRTVLQSGNVVFEASRAKPLTLTRTLEAAIEKSVAARITVVIRSPDELKDALARNPFTDEARNDPSHLLVMFLDLKPEKAALARLIEAHRGPEKLALDGTELFLTYPEGIGTSKLTGTMIEKHLGVRGTARNWRTVAKLIEAAKSLAG